MVNIQDMQREMTNIKEKVGNSEAQKTAWTQAVNTIKLTNYIIFTSQ